MSLSLGGGTYTHVVSQKKIAVLHFFLAYFSVYSLAVLSAVASSSFHALATFSLSLDETFNLVRKTSSF